MRQCARVQAATQSLRDESAGEIGYGTSQIKTIGKVALERDATGAQAGVTAALHAGNAPETFLEDGLIAAMGDFVWFFEENEHCAWSLRIPGGRRAIS